MNRIEAGYCTSVNPFNANQATYISLKPDDIKVIVFWTKNARPMINKTSLLNDRGYRYYFQYTINGYPKEIEPNIPSLDESIETFKCLSDKIGPQKVIWRYDPIVISNLTPPEYHIRQFRRIAKSLFGYARHTVVSIVDEYRAAKKRLRRAGILYDPNPDENSEFPYMMTEIAGAAQEFGFEIFSCAEAIDLRPYGIMPGKCIDDEYIRSVFGVEVIPDKDKYQRQECGCVISKDIGYYNTCRHGCAYCYATRADNSVRNEINHFPDSPSIIGRVDADPPQLFQTGLFFGDGL